MKDSRIQIVALSIVIVCCNAAHAQSRIRPASHAHAVQLHTSGCCDTTDGYQFALPHARLIPPSQLSPCVNVGPWSPCCKTVLHELACTVDRFLKNVLTCQAFCGDGCIVAGPTRLRDYWYHHQGCHLGLFATLFSPLTGPSCGCYPDVEPWDVGCTDCDGSCTNCGSDESMDAVPELAPKPKVDMTEPATAALRRGRSTSESSLHRAADQPTLSAPRLSSKSSRVERSSHEELISRSSRLNASSIKPPRQRTNDQLGRVTIRFGGTFGKGKTNTFRGAFK